MKKFFRIALAALTLLAVSCRRSDPGYGREPAAATAVEVTSSGEPPGADLIGPSGSAPEVRTLPPSAGRSNAPRGRKVVTDTSPNVMRVHYDGAGKPLDDGRVVRAGTPADRPIRQPGPNEAVVIRPDGSVQTAPAGVVITPEKLAAIMAKQGPYRGPQPNRESR